jgi:carbamoyltransferase
MEFGERALGNRSILADPRNKSIKDKINSIIKYRESYRPFAPVCIVEDASKYFQLTKHEEIQFMEKVIKIREQYKNSLAAVSHVDLSARLQTLSKSDNPRLYNILLEFEKYSGFPILLNTSFNINGEPIVCSPDDALNTFFNSGLETLVIGNFVIKK